MVVLALLLTPPFSELTLLCARYVSELSIFASVDRYIFKYDVAEAPTPLFVTVLDIVAFSPVVIVDGTLNALTTRSTPLNTVIAPDTALLFVSSLSIFASVDRYIFKYDVAEAPTPLFVTVLDIVAFSPV